MIEIRPLEPSDWPAVERIYAQGIATGLATETVGMSSGTFRYLRMKQIDGAAVKKLLPTVAAGVLTGLLIFSRAPREYLQLIVGLVVAVGASQLVRGMLYGLSPLDPVAFLGMIALLVAAALLAMYRPARQAARVDPLRTLRSD